MAGTALLYTDLGGLCQPEERIAPVRERTKWNAVPYESTGYSGTMLVSIGGVPETVTLPLQAEGWYRIFVGLPNYNRRLKGDNTICLKLTGDGAPMHLSPDGDLTHTIQEVFWRCADLTGQDLEISRHHSDTPSSSMLAWIRLVPMTDEEEAAYKTDMARTDTKRLYATNDMHGMFFQYNFREPEDWNALIQDYADSDVQWLSLENVRPYDGDTTTDDFSFPRSGDRQVQENLKRYYTPELMTSLVAYGHRQGLKMCFSMRMGIWALEFPYDQMCYDNHFAMANPQWRCVDRDGASVYAMSYAYPDVQDYVIDQFVTMARSGCDAVEMICNRGVPYVLFEPPFVERFRAAYGIDPCVLPLDDERIITMRCQIMTEFVRRLRARLDAAAPGVGLHARGLFSLHDSRLVGLDLETWAREGLITAVLSFPQRIREVLPEDARNADGTINLEAYSRHAAKDLNLIMRRQTNVIFIPPEPDSRGVPTGPASTRERIEEFMRLEKQYGVTAYIEIMPRQMPPEEYKRRALEIYDCGGEHIALWDTYGRAPNKLQWSMVRRLGHKEELPGFDSGVGVQYNTYRVTAIGGKSIERYLPIWGG